MEWAATSERCTNEIFNITNGDFYRWSQLWKAFADDFGMEVAEPQTISLTKFMADKESVWKRIVEKHKLQPNR